MAILYKFWFGDDEVANSTYTPVLKTFMGSQLKQEIFFDAGMFGQGDIPKTGRQQLVQAVEEDEDTGTTITVSLGYGDIIVLDKGCHIIVLDYSETKGFSSGCYTTDTSLDTYVYMSLAKEPVLDVDVLEELIERAVYNYKDYMESAEIIMNITAPSPNLEEILPPNGSGGVAVSGSDPKMLGECCVMQMPTIPITIEGLPASTDENFTEFGMSQWQDFLSNDKGQDLGVIDALINAYRDMEI